MDLLRAANELYGDSHQKGDDIYIGSFGNAVKATSKQLKAIKAKAKEIDIYVIKEKRKREIVSRLSQIDIEAIRPLRAVANGAATEFDKQKLSKLDTEAENLRKELAGL